MYINVTISYHEKKVSPSYGRESAKSVPAVLLELSFVRSKRSCVESAVSDGVPFLGRIEFIGVHESVSADLVGSSSCF